MHLAVHKGRSEITLAASLAHGAISEKTQLIITQRFYATGHSNGSRRVSSFCGAAMGAAPAGTVGMSTLRIPVAAGSDGLTSGASAGVVCEALTELQDSDESEWCTKIEPSGVKILL